MLRNKVKGWCICWFVSGNSGRVREHSCLWRTWFIGQVNFASSGLFTKFEFAVWTKKKLRNHAFDATISPADDWEPKTAKQYSPSRVRRLCVYGTVFLYLGSLDFANRANKDLAVLENFQLNLNKTQFFWKNSQLTLKTISFLKKNRDHLKRTQLFQKKSRFSQETLTESFGTLRVSVRDVC